MTNKQKLNSLVQQAKDGCTEALWEIRAIFHGGILTLSEENASTINQISFEENCYTRINAAIRNFDPLRGDFVKYVKFKIYEELKQQRQRNSNRVKMVLSLEGLQVNDDEGLTGFDPADDLAVVDAEFLMNEKIALLAEGDSRKLAALNAWINDYTDTETALFLAKQYGGKSESHRKFLTRFKTKCQTALADAI